MLKLRNFDDGIQTARGIWHIKLFKDERERCVPTTYTLNRSL